MQREQISSQKCGQNGCQPQIPLVKWTKKRNFCETPRVFSAKVAQTMDFLAWGRHRQPGGAKWRRLGADLPVKMWSEWMRPSNSPRKVDKLMHVWRKSSCFLSQSCSGASYVLFNARTFCTSDANAKTAQAVGRDQQRRRLAFILGGTR